MNPFSRRFALRGVACFLTGISAGISAFAQHAVAQTFPTKPIRFIVPYPPGGPLDIIARGLAEPLKVSLGQPVIVENKPGAGGNIGADLVAKATPDGHTIVMGAVATHAINPALYPKMPYDALRDFAPVALVAVVPNVLVLNPAVKARSVPELVALLRANPGKFNFGSGSNGSAGHLAGELFKQRTQTFMVHIPYAGGTPAMLALLAGQTDLMFDNLANAMQHIKAGKLTALAVTTAERAPSAPELPTLQEAGGAAFKGFDVSTWFGVLAPAGTPPETVTRLNRAVVAALGTPEMQERMAKFGATTDGNPQSNSPQAFAALIAREHAKYAQVVQRSGAKLD
jgi:tripartite-type tricarboxylate transporter receptor subunit TctC